MSTEPTARLHGPADAEETTVRVTPPAIPAPPDGTGPWQLRAAVVVWWIALGLGLLTTPLFLGAGNLWVYADRTPVAADPFVIVAGVVAGLVAVAHWSVLSAATVGLGRSRLGARTALSVLAALSVLTDAAAILLVGRVLIVGLCAWHLAAVVAGTVLMWARPVGAHLAAAVVEQAPAGRGPVAGLAPDVVPTPPRRRPGVPVVIGAVVLGLLLAAVQLIAFAGGSYRHQVAGVIGSGLGRSVTIGTVECSWMTGAAAFVGGAVGHTCDTVLDGTPAAVEVTSQNAENFDATTLNVENVPLLEQQLGRTLQRSGQPVTSVSCGDGSGRRILPAPVGTRFACRAVGPGRQGTLYATVRDAYGHTSVSDR
jgi:hypothetical protein